MISVPGADNVTGRLAGRTALVIGAGSITPEPGNGAATALLFGQAGARVFCVDRDLGAAGRTAGWIREAGGEAEAFSANVVDQPQMAKAVATCVRLYGGIDVLHYNVGIGTPGRLHEVAERHFDLVMKVNLAGAYLASQLAIPYLLESPAGAIVNVSSVASLVTTGVPLVAYGASKAGVNRLTQAIAAQYAHAGLRCNAVLPGLIESPTVYSGLSSDPEDASAMRERRNRASPTGRMGTVWDVAYASLFLASDDSSYLTGVLLPVDGAITARAV